MESVTPGPTSPVLPVSHPQTPQAIEPVSTPPQAAEQPIVAPKHKGRKILLGGIALVVVLIGLFLATLFGGTKGVEMEAEEVFTQITSGQVEEAYENSWFREEMTLEQFQSMLGMGKTLDLTKAKRIRWSGRGFDNDVKYIYGEFEFSNGSKQTITFEFMGEDDDLKLSGIVGGKPDTSL